jgi:DNA-binding MurR/RpiR family transcriptional regulator
VVRETEHLTDVMTSRFVQLAVVDMLYVSMIFANKERALANVHDTSVAAAKKKL